MRSMFLPEAWLKTDRKKERGSIQQILTNKKYNVSNLEKFNTKRTKAKQPETMVGEVHIRWQGKQIYHNTI